MKQVQHTDLRKYIVTGIGPDEPVTSNNCSLKGQVYYYMDEKHTVEVHAIGDGMSEVKLKTRKGMYIFKKHATQNMYVCQDTPVGPMHIVLKKMVGQITYWAEVES
jgi:hypothetical protein